MAEFKNVLILQAVNTEGEVLAREEIDLRNALILSSPPNTTTAARVGMQAYMVNDGIIRREYVCTAAQDGKYVWAESISYKTAKSMKDVVWMATKTESIGDVIFPEQSVTGLINNLQYEIQPDLAYDVIIDGKIYTCTAGAYGSSGAYIGNAALAGSPNLPHNNEPFCILWYGGTAKGALFYKDDTLSSPLRVKVTEHTEIKYNKLPKEFLPDEFAVIHSPNGTAWKITVSDEGVISAVREQDNDGGDGDEH